jgi:transposase
MSRSRPGCSPTLAPSAVTGVRSSPTGRASIASSSKHVTLSILWDEYIERNRQGYRYSRFCELYRLWEAKLSVTMRQTHVGGDKLFVDYAGDTVPVIVDRLTGEVRQAQIFVGVMGAWNFTYIEATWTQTLGDWIGAHTRALAAIGGAPRLIVPDNAKVAVIKACRYEPQVNRTYAEMAAHYGTAVLPTRPRRPRDKAKVEACVLIVERWLIGRLRDRRFYSLAELNAAIVSCSTGSMRSNRSAGSGSRGGSCSKNSADRRSSPCRPSPMSSPNGACAGSVSTTTSMSTATFTAFPTASRGARWRCGSPPAPWRSSSRESGSPCTCGRAATASTRPRPTTCHPVMPLRRLDHRPHPQRCCPDRAGNRGAVRSHPAAATPLRAGLPILPRHPATGAAVWKLPPCAPSRSARSPTARSAPSSTTSLVEQQGEPFGMGQRCRFTGCFDLTEGVGHTVESELTQEIECGMG